MRYSFLPTLGYLSKIRCYWVENYDLIFCRTKHFSLHCQF